jgi:heme-degrading monooxygenase HmoA
MPNADVAKIRSGRARPQRSLWSTADTTFVAVSRFSVNNGMEDDVERAFGARPHRVDEAPGFISMEVLRGVDDGRDFWLLTRWRDEASFEQWHRGHTFKASHEGMPSGLKLVPGSAVLSRLRTVCE